MRKGRRPTHATIAIQFDLNCCNRRQYYVSMISIERIFSIIRGNNIGKIDIWSKWMRFCASRTDIMLLTTKTPNRIVCCDNVFWRAFSPNQHLLDAFGYSFFSTVSPFFISIIGSYSFPPPISHNKNDNKFNSKTKAIKLVKTKTQHKSKMKKNVSTHSNYGTE